MLPSPPTTALQLRLLHQPVLAAPSRPEHPLQRKDAALLAILALQGPTARSQLTTLLWPDATENGAHNNLRQRLFRLRRAAGCDVVRHAATLSFATPVTHDLEFLTEALRRDPQAAQGALLGGLDYGDSGDLAAWVEAQRQRWRSTLHAALTGIALDLERRLRPADALPYALRLAHEQPADEAAAQLLIRLHLLAGDRAAALAEFDRCVRVLHEQFGRPPSEDTVALARLVGRTVPTAYAAPTPLALALRQPPRTVGRDAVFAAAERCWQADQVVLLTGPAGIGKTRVLDELAQRWRVALRLQATPDDATEPHGLLKRLVAALLPRLDADVAEADAAWLRWIGGMPDQARPPGPLLPGRQAGLLQAALASAARAGVAGIAIDDLHCADAGSLAVLCALLPGSRQAPAGPKAALRWLLAARDEGLQDPIQAWLLGIDGRFDPVVPLLPLQRQHIGDLLATVSTSDLDIAAWAERLDQHCGGHPLLLLQVLRELHRAQPQLPKRPPTRLPMPAETLAMIARRLGQAEERTQQLACVAALCGDDFNASMAARLLRCGPADLLRPWRQLQEMNILQDQAFSHELVRQAVLDAVPASVAPLIHREIAEALRGDPDCTGRRALHWEAGAAHAAAADDFTQAADAALARGLHLQAHGLLRRAARNHREAGQTGEAALCEWRAGHLLLTAASASEAVTVARMLLDTAQEPVQKVRALELLSRSKGEQHDSSALADAEAAHAIARSLGDPALLALTRLCLASAWTVVGRHHDALTELEALRVQPDLLDPQRQAERADLHSVALAHLGRRRESIQASRHGLEAATARADLAVAAGCAGNIAVQLAYLGQIEESIGMYEHAIDLGHRAGIERGYVLVDEMGLAGNHADQGRYATALGMFERVAKALHEAGYIAWAVNAENDWAMTLLRLGRFDLAQRLLADPVASAPAWAQAARRLAQARLMQWRGAPVLATVQEAASLLDAGGALGNPYVRERIELELARCTAPDVAADKAARTLRWARRHEFVALGWQAGMVRTAALLELGRNAQAARSAEALAAQFADGWRAFGFYLPEMWLVLCNAFQAGGRHERAGALAAEGVRWLNERLAHDVPELHRSSFLERNPFNSRLLRWPTP